MIGDQIRSNERVKVEAEDDFISIILSMDKQLQDSKLEFPIAIRIENVSLGGLKFWCREELMVGSILTFRIRIDGHIIEAKAKILRCKKEEDIFLIAAQFFQITDHAKYIINGYIKKKKIHDIKNARKNS